MIVQSAIASSRRRKYSAAVAASQRNAFNAVLRQQQQAAAKKAYSTSNWRVQPTGRTLSTPASSHSSRSVSRSSSVDSDSGESHSCSRGSSPSRPGSPTPTTAARRAISLIDPFTLVGDEIDHANNHQLGLVDLSGYGLTSLPDEVVGEHSEDIEHLILDGNQLTEASLSATLPSLPALKSLSLNRNKLKNVGVVLQLLARKCPDLRFLSLIGNPGWPHPIQQSQPDEKLYGQYVHAAAKLLPSLRFLDTSTVVPSRTRRHRTED